MMDHLQIRNYREMASHFNQFSHHHGLIYSIIENQYEGHIYVDHTDKPKVMIMFTPFDFSFITGIETLSDAETALSMIKKHASEFPFEEQIFFTDSDASHAYLSDQFKKYRAIQTIRYTYKLNHQKFKEIFDNHDFKHIIKTYEQKDYLSLLPYWISEVKEAEKSISYCKAFARGGGYAELDVYTDEEHQQKGYAFECALKLIDKLIDNKIEPEWNTWPYRKASQKLAMKLGFEFDTEVKAIVWVKGECLPLNMDVSKINKD